MNIGICGGTFDPFHRGHLEPVLAIRREMSWDRIIYVPAWRQPFKTDRQSSSPYHRFAMSVLATQNDDSLYVSQIELERGGISYTVDTLQMLQTMYPGATFDWIIGDDNVAQLMTWKDPERLFKLARFVVLARGGPAPAPEMATASWRCAISPPSSIGIPASVKCSARRSSTTELCPVQ